MNNKMILSESAQMSHLGEISEQIFLLTYNVQPAAIMEHLSFEL